MKKFRLTIECENDAFADGTATQEIAAILRKLAERVSGAFEDDFFKYRNVTDSNGNVCGTFRLKDENDDE